MKKSTEEQRFNEEQRNEYTRFLSLLIKVVDHAKEDNVISEAETTFVMEVLGAALSGNKEL